ncbi:helix-turn-helix domain-containing protein [Corynebacterium lubricantis]|uniref:helix-turn-helix domain-containing protein n=1 Tax=Corynebacterium lubricantis TaxID=541095 RepID=UPI0012EA29ED|nr:helix-turn-helix domain-containing protein [Corynebacterium lubricantis]
MWEGHNAKALIPLDIRTIDDRPMQASETNLYLPSVRMASVFGTSQIVERSESFIADNPTGVVAIFFATEGDAFFFHRAGNISLRPGQAIVYDADRPFVRGFNHRFRELVLTIPKQRYREILGPKGPELPAVFEFGATGNPGEQALARLVKESLARIEGGQLQHIDYSDYSEPKPWSGIEDEAIGLIRNVLGEDASSEEGLISAAKNHIELNIGDRELSPGQVAAAVGISERQLSRIFADAGTTVGRYVLNQRLGFAKSALSAPEQDLISVGEIGQRFGFASQSHFGRTFRERFEMTPLQWRKEAQRQRLQD